MHTMPSKLTPVSGCAVQASSVVAHFVSINVSEKGKQKENNTIKQGRKKEISRTFSCFIKHLIKLAKWSKEQIRGSDQSCFQKTVWIKDRKYKLTTNWIDLDKGVLYVQVSMCGCVWVNALSNTRQTKVQTGDQWGIVWYFTVAPH